MIDSIQIGKLYKQELFGGLTVVTCVIDIEDNGWDKCVVYHILSDPEKVWRDNVIYVLDRWQDVAV